MARLEPSTSVPPYAAGATELGQAVALGMALAGISGLWWLWILR